MTLNEKLDLNSELIEISKNVLRRKGISSEDNVSEFNLKIDELEPGLYYMIDLTSSNNGKNYTCNYIYIFDSHSNIIPHSLFGECIAGKYIDAKHIKFIYNLMGMYSYLGKTLEAVFIPKSSNHYKFRLILPALNNDICNFKYGLLLSKNKLYGFYNDNKGFEYYYNIQTLNKSEIKDMKKTFVPGDFYLEGLPEQHIFDNNYKIYYKDSEIHENCVKVPIKDCILNYISTLLQMKLNNIKFLTGYTLTVPKYIDSSALNEVFYNIINEKVYLGNIDKAVKNDLITVVRNISKIESLQGRQKLRKGTLVMFDLHYYIYLGNINGRYQFAEFNYETGINNSFIHNNIIYNILRERFENIIITEKCTFPIEKVLEQGIQFMLLPIDENNNIISNNQEK